MKSFYSKQFLTFIRIASCIFIAILFYLTGHAVYDVFFVKDYGCIFGLICGPLSILILFFVVFSPERLALFVPPLILYSLSNAIGNANPTFPIIFLELAIVLLWVRGFFNYHKAIKIISLSLFYLITVLLYLRSGWAFFSKQLLDILQILLISFCIIFIIYEYMKAQSQNIKDKILNIAEFPETTERDAKWLTLVQQGVKYEAIAIDYELTLGTVQNRLNKIYHILETGDRIGFLSIYSNTQIIYKK
ncbi:MAG: hypothetical protein K6A89_01260 [Treponema sp.]|nr:hypothetical protein [Treponema sp.]